jgi:hypothetical protein
MAHNIYNVRLPGNRSDWFWAVFKCVDARIGGEISPPSSYKSGPTVKSSGRR